MTVNRKKKVRKFRGSKTHGCGSKKKARGAGNRGGRGMAGSGKRAKHKKPGLLKLAKGSYLGKHGFFRQTGTVIEQKIINIEELPLVEEVNLTEKGYTKLLSRGIPQMKHNITVPSCSKKAKEKIENAGGKIISA